MQAETVSPRYSSASIIWEMDPIFHLKVVQSACIQTVAERSDIGNELYIHDNTSLGMLGVTEDFKVESRLWNLAGICL